MKKNKRKWFLICLIFVLETIFISVRKKQSELAWNILEFWPSSDNLRVNLSVNNDIIRRIDYFLCMLDVVIIVMHRLMENDEEDSVLTTLVINRLCEVRIHYQMTVITIRASGIEFIRPLNSIIHVILL